MKKVLIISYYFPPDSAIGGLRIQGLAKYLPEFGWKPIILTKNFYSSSIISYNIVKTPYCEYNSIASFKKRFFFNPKISLTDSLNLNSSKNNKSLKNLVISSLFNFITSIVAYPDSQKSWYKSAVLYGCSILENENIDVVISSSYPATCHIIANSIKKKYNIPWIADLRDLWTQNHYYPYNCIRKFFEKNLEIKTLSNAEALTTVSEPLVETLKKNHYNKIIYSINNGFDPQYTNDLSTLTKKFTISYTGVLYKGKRDPTKFFKAIKELIDDQKVDPANIEVRFYGPKEDWLNNDIIEHGLENIVNDYGLVSREIALEKQKESHILLLLLWDHPDEVGVYTGKLFDYLAAKRPILAIGSTKGVVSELLSETNAGSYSTSTEDLKLIIQKYYNEYMVQGYVSYNGIQDKIDKYSQREMSRKFAELMEKLVEDN